MTPYRDPDKVREMNRRAAAKRWADPKKRARLQEQRRGYALKLKRQAMDAYGGVCACCGEKELLFLTIDHIDGGGNKHRGVVGAGKIYRWLRDNGFPKEYQVLCFNCNFAKSQPGGCPHQKKEE